MPTAVLNDEDVIKALDFLTGYKYNINTIVKKKVLSNGELEIFWSHLERKKKD